MAYTDCKVRDTIKKLKLGSMRFSWDVANKYFVYERPKHSSHSGMTVFDKDGNLLYDNVSSIGYGSNNTVNITINTKQGEKCIVLNT